MMKTGMKWMMAMAAAMAFGTPAVRAANDDRAALAQGVSNYVAKVMDGLRAVAEQQPTVKNYRELMKPFVADTPGLFGASMIDTNFVIRAVYYKRDFLAVGFDLKKVKELDYFWKLMREKPAPQLSEPGHGSLVQPRLVAMRYPIVANGQFTGIVSAMLHTEAFLKETGLDRCRAYKIICLGALAEEKGEFTGAPQEIELDLPSTKWVIQFQK